MLGGIITQYLGWRWNFFINVPIAAVVLVSGLKWLPKHESEEKHTSLDLPGAVLVTSGLITLVYGLVKAPASGWLATSSLLFFGIAIVLLALFVLNESRAKHPLIPLSIFKLRNVSGANLIQLSIGAALFSVFFFCSLYVQDILGYSPVRTGLSFLIMPFVIAITATNAPKLIKRVGFKPILMIAPLFIGLGLFILGHIPVHGSYFTHIMPGLIVMAFGLGFTFVSLLVAATSGVAGHLSGLASGLVNTAQQIGGSLGLAVLTGVASASTTRYLINAHRVVTPALRAAATVHGFQRGFYVALSFSIIAALLATLVIKRPKQPSSTEDSSAIPL